MAQNYTRQSTLSDGDTITASLFNDEYNQLVNAFTYSSTSASSTGHRHDGSAGQGGNIFKIGDLDFLNKIEVDSTNNRWGFYVEVSSAAVEQIRIQDGSIVPVTTNDIDLGTSSFQFKDLYIDGTANVDSLTLTSGATVTTILDEDDLSSDSATALVTQQSVKAYIDAQVTAQDLDFQADTGGALSIDLDSETLTFTGGTGIDTSGSGNAVTFAIDSTVATLTGTQTLTNKTLTTPVISSISNTGTLTLPTSTDTLVGRATTDTLTNKTLTSPDINTPDIDGGTIDGATIATSDITVGTGKTLDVSSGTLTLADDQISGDKVEGGTIASTTITSLASTTVDTTNLEVTNIKAKDGTSAGSIADSTGVVTLASSVLTTTDINGGTIDNTVIGGTTTAAGSFTSVNATSLDVAGTVEFDGLSGTGAVSVTDILDQDDMSSNSATALATQQSIKAYVDSQVATADTLSEVLANGNTTGGTNILFGDNDKAIFGGGSDLQIYHDGSASYVEDAGTGNLRLKTNGVGLQILDGSDLNLALFNAGSGQSYLYNVNGGVSTQRLATTTTGIDVTGTITFDGGTTTANVNFGDNDKAIFGAGSDLQIYHTGLVSVIEDSGTGNLLIRGSDMRLQNAAGSNNYLKAVDGGEVELMHAGATKLATTSTGIDVTGTIVGDGLTVDGANTINISDNTAYSSTSRANGFLQINNTNTTSGVFSGIELIATGTGSAGAAEILCIDSGSGSGDLAFSTRNGGTWGEKVRIEAGGNVGIGTDSAAYTLHTKSSSGGVALIESTASNSDLYLKDSGTTYNYSNGIGSVGDDLRFRSGDGSERMRINSTGVVDVKGAGSASAPSLILAGDDDTGQFRPSANQIAWATGGTERLRVKNWEVTVNEQSSDVDFRVESDTNTHMLFMDAVNNRVNIGTTDVSSQGTLAVNGSAIFGRSSTTTGDLFSSGGGNSGAYNGIAILSNSDGLTAQANTSLSSWIVDIGGRAADGVTFPVDTADSFVVRRVAAGGTYYGSANYLHISGGSTVINEDSNDHDFRVESNNNENMLKVDAGNNRVGVGLDPTNTFEVKSSGSNVNEITLQHSGNTVDIVALGQDNNHGSVHVKKNNGLTSHKINAADGVVFNDDSTDQDFRVESNSNTHMLFVDAGNDRIGVNTSAPDKLFHVFGGNSGSAYTPDGADIFILENSDSAIIDIRTPAANSGGILFSDAGARGRGQILYSHSTDTLNFTAGGTQIQTIASDGSTFHDAVTITTGDNTHQLKLISTDADSGVGPVLELYRNSASPADGDGLGRMYFYGNNSAGEKTEYALIRTNVSDVTDATEDSILEIFTYSAGAQASKFRAAPTETVINESSKDIDFRVESDSNAHALFVDAGSSVVNINTGTSSAFALKVIGTATSGARTGFFGGPDVNGSTATSAPVLVLENTDTTTGNMTLLGFQTSSSIATGVIGFKNLDLANGYGTFYLGSRGAVNGWSNKLFVYDTEYVINEDSLDYDFRVESDSIAHMLFVDAGNDTVKIGTTENAVTAGSANARLVVANGIEVTQDLAEDSTNKDMLRLSNQGSWSNSGNSGFYSDITWDNGGTNTMGRIGLRFGGTTTAGNSEFTIRDMYQGGFGASGDVVSFGSNKKSVFHGSMIVNEDGLAQDFRVESDNSTHALFVDASTDRVGILNSGPQTPLEVTANNNQVRLSTASDPTNYHTNFSNNYDSTAPFTIQGYYNGTQVDFLKITAASGFSAPVLRLGEDMSYVSLLTGTTERVTVAPTEAIVNDLGNDYDFRVESDTNTHAIFLDASTDEVQFFKSNGSLTTAGAFFQSTGRLLITTSSTIEPLILNRQDTDGLLVEFRQANSVEGNISVSGSTVSYNGFAGRHESSGIASSTAKGTVVSTIDELDTYLSGAKQGQTRADHAKVKVSDVVGDACVYGVVDDFTDEGKVNIVSVGIGAVRVTGACSKGDLLESNGDGTAKVQSDDIVRSKTIGKVTIGDSNTGVKLVSCVLYCG